MKIYIKFNYAGRKYKFNAYFDNDFNAINHPDNNVDEHFEINESHIELQFIDRENRLMFVTTVDVENKSIDSIKIYNADAVTDTPIEIVDDVDVFIVPQSNNEITVYNILYSAQKQFAGVEIEHVTEYQNRKSIDVQFKLTQTIDIRYFKSCIATDAKQNNMHVIFDYNNGIRGYITFKY